MTDSSHDEADENAGSSDLEQTLTPSTANASPAPDEGATIGPYRLLEKIGDGGMGTLFMTQGRLDEAEPLMVESLQGQERALGADHPSTTTMRVVLAELYHDMRRLEESRVQFQQALQAAEQTLGPNDRVVADILEPYAVLLATMGDGAGAAEMRARVAKIRGK
jgi:hypothetical protein